MSHGTITNIDGAQYMYDLLLMISHYEAATACCDCWAAC